MSNDICCLECSLPLELKTTKNSDTQMYENYWWCDDHGKVTPYRPDPFSDYPYGRSTFMKWGSDSE